MLMATADVSAFSGRAILFDLDNTLVDRAALAAPAIGVLLKALMPKQNPRERAATIAELLRLDDHGYGAPEALCAQLSRLVAQPVSLQQFQAALIAQIRPCERTRCWLEALASRFTIGVVSNGGDAQFRKLAAAGLSSVFAAHVFVSSKVGVAKPRAAIFEFACQQIGASPAETLFVGDHPHCDIAGAAACALQTCWLANGRSYPDRVKTPDYMVDSIADLRGRLK